MLNHKLSQPTVEFALAKTPCRLQKVYSPSFFHKTEPPFSILEKNLLLLWILWSVSSDIEMLFSPLIDLEKILLSAIIQIRGKFHDKKRLYARIQRTDIKGMPRGRECCCCRQTA